MSIDRYGNELQINGKKEFKDMVVEAAAANNLPVILKPAELQEQLIARRKELEMEQKVEVGNSIEKATLNKPKMNNVHLLSLFKVNQRLTMNLDNLKRLNHSKLNQNKPIRQLNSLNLFKNSHRQP